MASNGGEERGTDRTDGRTDRKDAAYNAAVLAAMMEELGPGRREALPLEDGKSRQRVGTGGLLAINQRNTAFFKAPLQSAKKTSNNLDAQALSAWTNMKFDDVKSEDEALDSIGDGQLHRIRRLELNPGQSEQTARSGHSRRSRSGLRGGPPGIQSIYHSAPNDGQRGGRHGPGRPARVDRNIVAARLGSGQRGPAFSAKPWSRPATGDKRFVNAPTTRRSGRVPPPAAINYDNMLVDESAFFAAVMPREPLVASNTAIDGVNLSKKLEKLEVVKQTQTTKQTEPYPPMLADAITRTSSTTSSKSNDIADIAYNVHIHKLTYGLENLVGLGSVSMVSRSSEDGNKSTAIYMQINLSNKKRLMLENISKDFTYIHTGAEVAFESIAGFAKCRYRLEFPRPAFATKFAAAIDAVKATAFRPDLETTSQDAINPPARADRGIEAAANPAIESNLVDTSSEVGSTKEYVSPYVNQLAGLSWAQIADVLMDKHALETIAHLIGRAGPLLSQVEDIIASTSLVSDHRTAQYLATETLITQNMAHSNYFSMLSAQLGRAYVSNMAKELLDDAILQQDKRAGNEMASILVDVNDDSDFFNLSSPMDDKLEQPDGRYKFSLEALAEGETSHHRSEIYEQSGRVKGPSQTVTPVRDGVQDTLTSTEHVERQLQCIATEVAPSTLEVQSHLSHSIDRLHGLRHTACEVVMKLPTDWSELQQEPRSGTTKGIPDLKQVKTKPKSRPMNLNDKNSDLKTLNTVCILNTKRSHDDVSARGTTTSIWATTPVGRPEASKLTNVKPKDVPSGIFTSEAKDVVTTEPKSPEIPGNTLDSVLGGLGRLKLDIRDQQSTALKPSQTIKGGLASSKWAPANQDGTTSSVQDVINTPKISHKGHVSSASALIGDSSMMRPNPAPSMPNGLSSSIFATRQISTRNELLERDGRKVVRTDDGDLGDLNTNFGIEMSNLVPLHSNLYSNNPKAIESDAKLSNHIGLTEAETLLHQAAQGTWSSLSANSLVTAKDRANAAKLVEYPTSQVVASKSSLRGGLASSRWASDTTPITNEMVRPRELSRSTVAGNTSSKPWAFTPDVQPFIPSAYPSSVQTRDAMVMPPQWQPSSSSAVIDSPPATISSLSLQSAAAPYVPLTPRFATIIVDDEHRPGHKRLMTGPEVDGNLPFLAYITPTKRTKTTAKQASTRKNSELAHDASAGDPE